MRVEAERVADDGEVLVALDPAEVAALAPAIRAAGVESLAIGFLQAYANPAHERLAEEVLAPLLPGVVITRAADVCAEVREYDRLSTACVNAYVRPLMSRYLQGLASRLAADGFRCPMLVVTSGGGMTTIDVAQRYPVRLIESGPAGGTVLAADLARACGLPRAMSFDMGGTTAKICFVDDFEPQHARSFEAARIYRFAKGSGLPLRIPVIEMVEIGAGGGSLASIDALGRLAVGPESASSDPGPACYARDEHFAVGGDALGDLVAQRARHQRLGPADEEVVEREPALGADLDDVPKTRRGEQRGARALALDQRVGGERGAVDDHAHVARRAPGARQRLPDRRHETLRRIGIGGQDLGGRERVAVGEHDVGERSADVDGEAGGHAAGVKGFGSNGSRPD